MHVSRPVDFCSNVMASSNRYTSYAITPRLQIHRWSSVVKSLFLDDTAALQNRILACTLEPALVCASFSCMTKQARVLVTMQPVITAPSRDWCVIYELWFSVQSGSKGTHKFGTHSPINHRGLIYSSQFSCLCSAAASLLIRVLLTRPNKHRKMRGLKLT